MVEKREIVLKFIEKNEVDYIDENYEHYLKIYVKRPLFDNNLNNYTREYLLNGTEVPDNRAIPDENVPLKDEPIENMVFVRDDKKTKKKQ